MAAWDPARPFPSCLLKALTVVLGQGAEQAAIVGMLWKRETEAQEPECRGSAQKQ